MKDTNGSPEVGQADQDFEKLGKNKLVPLVHYPSYVDYGEEFGTEGNFNPAKYWEPIRRRLWLIIGFAALVSAMTAVYMARKPNVYQAWARVQIDLEDVSSTLGVANGGPVVFKSSVNDPAYFNTQLQILTSAGLLRRVVKTLGSEQDPGAAAGAAAAGAPPPRLVAPPASGQDIAEAARLAPQVTAIASQLIVEPVKETRLPYKETRLIDIGYNHTDPETAAKVVNTIVDTFVLQNQEKKLETNQGAGKFLQQRIATLQSQIRAGEDQLMDYAKNKQIISLEASQNTVVDRLVGLSKKLLEAENDRQLAEATYHAALAAGDSVGEKSPQVAAVESKLADLHQRRAQLLANYTEEWPDVQTINQEIEELNKQVRGMRDRARSESTSTLETRYRQALAYERSLREAFDRQRSETQVQNEAAVNYRIIEQEITTNKNLLDALLQRFKENQVLLEGAANNISVLDYAVTPRGAVGPRRSRAVGAALILSLGLGVLCALLLNFFEDSVRSEEEVEKLLHLPVMAAIPAFTSLTRHNPLRAADPRRLLGGREDAAAALVKPDTDSLVAEVYRQLRTSVLMTFGSKSPRSLLITSGLSGEGKTTTAVNLALSLARTGGSVLLIDADMRRPRLHSTFGLDGSRGLSTLLSDECLSSRIMEENVMAMIQQDESRGISLLAAGPPPPNPSELIGSVNMHRLLGFLGSVYTHVIIDSPPAAFLTDSVLISTMVEGVVLVVEPGRSERSTLRRLQKALSDVGANVMGVVMNKTSVRARDYKHYDRYVSEWKESPPRA